LLNYDGTLIAVSHDREFLDGLVTKVYEFGNRQIKEHLGGIYEFLDRIKLASLAELERRILFAPLAPAKEDTRSKQAFLNKKEYDREIRKLDSRIEKTEIRIAEIEMAISEYEAKIANPADDLDTIMTPEFYAAYTGFHTELKQKMEEWEQLHNELERLKNKRN
jgi:ATP-binding cassette subfamily F protein 3